MPSLHVVSQVGEFSFGPFDNLLPDVALAARDVDAAYQAYGRCGESSAAASGR